MVVDWVGSVLIYVLISPFFGKSLAWKKIQLGGSNGSDRNDRL